MPEAMGESQRIFRKEVLKAQNKELKKPELTEEQKVKAREIIGKSKMGITAAVEEELKKNGLM